MIRTRLISATAIVVLSCTMSFRAQSTTPPAPPRHVGFSTLIGGEFFDPMNGVAVDAAGRLHVVGTTCASILPTTADAVKRTRGQEPGCDGYLAIFSPSGSLLYGTWIGGSADEGLTGIALDPSGNIYLTGMTTSRDLPTTTGAYDRTCGNDGACTTGLTFTFDAFVMKLAPLGRGILVSTYLGGGDYDIPDGGIAVDSLGRMHIAGRTASADFPATAGAARQSLFAEGAVGVARQDAFYSRLSADGSQLLYSTYLGGTHEDWTWALAVDASGNAYVGGQTDSLDVLTAAARQPGPGGGWDGWIARISGAGRYDYGSYLGGDGGDILFDIATQGNTAYLTGQTCSTTFPMARSRDCGTYIIKMAADGSFTRTVMVPRQPTAVALAIDAHERAYFLGVANTYWNLITTSDAAQPFSAGESDVAFGIYDMRDGQPDAPLYATFIGGSGIEDPQDLAIDAGGNVYIAGATWSEDFPTVNAVDSVPETMNDTTDGFAMKLTVEGFARQDVANEVVLYASDADTVAGRWEFLRDVGAAGGSRLYNQDAGAAKVPAPLAAPADYVDFTFTANANVPYRLWIRGKALGDHWANDSVYVQFSDSVDAAGNPIWRIGTTGGTSVNLEDSSNAGLAGWGWQDNGYGNGVLGAAVRFAASGTHTVRIQVREDGFSLDQIVLSASRYFDGPPGLMKRDSRVLARSNSDGTAEPPPDEEPPPPGTCDPREIVVHPGVSSTVFGAWVKERDLLAASQHRVRHPNAGAAKLTSAVAAPTNYFEVAVDVEAGVAYRLWIRGRTLDDHWSNDSVFVQFTNTVDASSNPIWRIGTTSATEVNLEECSGCGISGWGWQDNGYGAGVPGPVVRFATAGRQTLRVQTREDGFAIDQIVLSSAKYASSAPGAQKNDSTILPVCGNGPLPPTNSDPREIVLYPVRDGATLGGRWIKVGDTTPPGGYVIYPNAGHAKVTTPLADTQEIIEMQFNAEAGRPYRIWIRGNATNNDWANDSVWVQFSGTVNQTGTPIFRIATAEGTAVNLEDCSGCGLSGWGWQDNGWGVNVLGPEMYFQTTGVQRLRIQPREDGLAVDQIVISSGRYLSQSPGTLKNDATYVPR